MNVYELDEVVRKMVRRELMWYRHYWGVVLSNSDSLRKGRLQVQVPELRWNDQSSAKWCAPRLAPGLVVPTVGSKVEIYFVEGNPRRPVWLGRVTELGETFQSYTPGTDVLYESQAPGADSITYDGRQFNIVKAATPLAAARKGDATKSDATTDATNWAILTALAAMFGMTLTSLAGAINAGSSKVNIGG